MTLEEWARQVWRASVLELRVTASGRWRARLDLRSRSEWLDVPPAIRPTPDEVDAYVVAP